MLQNILRKFWKGSDYLLGNNDWIENNDWGSRYLSGGVIIYWEIMTGEYLFTVTSVHTNDYY